MVFGRVDSLMAWGFLLFQGELSASDPSIIIYESGNYRKMVRWTDPSQLDDLWTPPTHCLFDYSPVRFHGAAAIPGEAVYYAWPPFTYHWLAC